MREEIVGLGKFLIVPSAGITATFAMINQLLGTIAAILSITYVVWKWRMDKNKYQLDQNQLDEMNDRVEEMMELERKAYKQDEKSK